VVRRAPALVRGRNAPRGGPRAGRGGRGPGRPDGDGDPLATESFDADELASVDGERFADRADRLADADVSDAIADHLAELAEAYAAGEVHVADRESKRVLDATQAVERTPEASTYDWAVRLIDPVTGGPTTLTLSSEKWVSSCPGPALDRQLPNAMRDSKIFSTVSRDDPGRTDRWQAVKRSWERMAAESDDDATESDDE